MTRTPLPQGHSLQARQHGYIHACEPLKSLQSHYYPGALNLPRRSGSESAPKFDHLHFWQQLIQWLEVMDTICCCHSRNTHLCTASTSHHTRLQKLIVDHNSRRICVGGCHNTTGAECRSG